MIRVTIWVATILCLFADQLTGYLLYEGIIGEASVFSPSQILRSLTFLGIACFLLVFGHTLSSGILFLFGACFVFTELTVVLRGGDLHGLLYGLLVIAKILFLPLSVLFGVRVCRALIVKQSLELALNITFISMATLIWIYTLFDIGAATYPQGHGTKGYFASGNAVGISLGVGIIWLVVKLRHANASLRFLVIIFCTSALLQVGTKTSAIISVVALSFYAYEERSRFGVFFKLISVAALCVSVLYILDNFTEVKRRLEATESLSTFLLSHRNEKIADALDEVSANGSIVQALVGGGALVSYRSPSRNYQFDTLEQDWADIYFFYGLPGLIAYIWFFVWLSILCKGQPGALVVWALMLSHSSIAGHVMLNGFVSMSGGLVLASLLSGVQIARRKIPTIRDQMGGQKITNAING